MAAFSGMAAIENIPGACHRFCGTTYDPNQFNCAYPHYSACPGGSDCNAQPLLPLATNGCGWTITFSSCKGQFVCAILQDCGPSAGQLSSGGTCNPGGFHPLVACLNSKAFSQLCQCQNPMTLGTMFVSGDTNGCG
jgi:hypothetical protein